LLSKMMGLPWISDYRDPWTQAYFYFQRHILSKWIENSLERWLLKQSGKVLSINEEILKGLGEKYGFWHKPKWEVIPNGYDPENFKFLKPIKDDFFSITYTGTLNAKMRPDSFLKAIQELVVEQPRFGEHLHLYFIGRIGSDVQSLFNDSLLKEKIRYIPFLPHEDCLRYTMGANLLLLLIPECSTQHLIVTGKLFEYLQSGNPILGLVPEGEAADIIRKTRTGFVVSPEDREKIKRVLWFCYRCWEGRKRVLTETVRWDRVQKYDRKKGTEKLARILDEIYQRPIL
jgi:glycosyltransferase involved in cell wall biosynthesis